LAEIKNELAEFALQRSETPTAAASTILPEADAQQPQPARRRHAGPAAAAFAADGLSGGAAIADAATCRDA
jgi:hypothetical protein